MHVLPFNKDNLTFNFQLPISVMKIEANEKEKKALCQSKNSNVNRLY